MPGWGDNQMALEAEIERLRAERAMLDERLGASSRVLEERWAQMVLAETPIADHRYVVARAEHDRVQVRIGELETELARLRGELDAGSRRAG